MRLLGFAVACALALAGCGQTLWVDYKLVQITAVRGPDSVRVGELFNLALTIARTGEESASYCNWSQDVSARYE